MNSDMIIEPTRLLKTIMKHEHEPLSQMGDNEKTSPYLDTEDVWTIGFGTTSIYGASISEKTKPITKREAVHHMMADVYQAIIDAHEWMPAKAHSSSAVRTEAITELAYQMGLTRLSGFKKMLTEINRGDWEAASNELWNSLLAVQTPPRARTLAIRLQVNQYDTEPFDDLLFMEQVYGISDV